MIPIPTKYEPFPQSIGTGPQSMRPVPQSMSPDPQLIRGERSNFSLSGDYNWDSSETKKKVILLK